MSDTDATAPTLRRWASGWCDWNRSPRTPGAASTDRGAVRQIDARFDRVDARTDRMDARIDGLHNAVRVQLYWIVGSLAAVLGVMAHGCRWP